jgi:hypothetical protein
MRQTSNMFLLETLSNNDSSKLPHSLAITHFTHVYTWCLSCLKPRRAWIWKTETAELYLSFWGAALHDESASLTAVGRSFRSISRRSARPRAQFTILHYRTNALLEDCRNGWQFFHYVPASTLVVSVQGHGLLLQYREGKMSAISLVEVLQHDGRGYALTAAVSALRRNHHGHP